MMRVRCPHCDQVFVIDDASDNDKAIEHYYRVLAAGGKTTLRKVAEETGISYEALRKHKQRYDATGRWGSKKKPDNKD
jgi:hypothetical protein